MSDFKSIKDISELMGALSGSQKISLSPAPSEAGGKKSEVVEDVIPAPAIDSIKKVEAATFQQSLESKEMQMVNVDGKTGSQTPKGTIKDLLDMPTSNGLKTSGLRRSKLSLESDDFWEESESELEERAGLAALHDVGTSRTNKGGRRQERHGRRQNKVVQKDELENGHKQRGGRGKPYYHKLGTDFHTKDSISFAKKIDSNQLNSIFNLFQEQMATLEGEYDRARESLQAEYEEAYDDICATLDEERDRLHKIKERGREIKAQLDFERESVVAEKKRVLGIREKLTSDRRKLEAEHESNQLKLNEDRERLVNEMEAKDIELKAEARRIAEEQKKFNKQVEDLGKAKQELEGQRAAVDGDRSNNVTLLEEEKEALASDIREFETYKTEVDQLLETKQMIIKEEKEEFIKTRASELQAIAEKQEALDSELSRAQEIRSGIENEKYRVESDWNQKGSYLDIHTKQLEEERKRFDEEKLDYERQMEAERAKLKEQILAVEKFQDANASLIEQDKKKLIAERDRLLSEMQVERRHMENERIEAAKKIYELGQQLKRAQDIASSSSMLQAGSMPIFTPAAQMQPAIPPPGTGNNSFSFQPTPMPLSSTPRRAPFQGSPGPSSVPTGISSLTSETDISGRLTSIKVFVGTNEDRNFLGDVALGPNITLGDVRRMIQAQFRLTSGFSLRKKKIPIRPSQDHHKAHDFLKAVDDYLVVD